MAGFEDLRDWIDDLEERRDLKRIRAEVDWDEELGAITREVSSQSGPALLFENIKGHRNTSLPPPVYQRHRHAASACAGSSACRKRRSYREMVRIFKERFSQAGEAGQREQAGR